MSDYLQFSILAPSGSTRSSHGRRVQIVPHLGWKTNTHSDRILLLFDKIERLRYLLNGWRASRGVTPAREATSLTVKLWNMAFVLRAGKYSVSQLLRLTGLHDWPDRNRTTVVRLGRESHDGINMWRWALREFRSRVAGWPRGNVYGCWRRTTPSEEVFFRLEHYRGRRFVHQNVRVMEI